MTRLTKRQRDSLYRIWFLNHESAAEHRQALMTWSCPDESSKGRFAGMTDDERNNERDRLHSLSVAAFNKYLDSQNGEQAAT